MVRESDDDYDFFQEFVKCIGLELNKEEPRELSSMGNDQANYVEFWENVEGMSGEDSTNTKAVHMPPVTLHQPQVFTGKVKRDHGSGGYVFVSLPNYYHYWESKANVFMKLFESMSKNKEVTVKGLPFEINEKPYLLITEVQA